MTRLQTVTIKGLFGRVDHHLVMRKEAPTILTGPNGTGKTHVLRIVQATAALDAARLMGLPFDRACLEFDSVGIEVSRSQPQIESSVRDGVTLEIRVSKRNETPVNIAVNHEVLTDAVGTRSAELRLPPWIIQLPSGEFFDSHAERLVPARYVEQRYGGRESKNPLEGLPGGAAALQAVAELHVHMIDTKRLDLEVMSERREAGAPGVNHGRIRSYTDRIEAQIKAAKSQSLYRSQSADLRFAERALAAADKTVRDNELADQYDKISRLYEEMAANGLAPDEQPMVLPERTTPTIRRILSVLLDDWEARLAPLTTVNDKLNKLRAVIDEHFRPSGKRTHLTSRGTLQVRSLDGRRIIPVTQLSSGEQHLLAIFSELVFAISKDAIIMLDEPEISMHMSWQHRFVTDLEEACSGMGYQFIIATHSPGIINSRWDLMEELSLPDPTIPAPGEVPPEEIDDDHGYL